MGNAASGALPDAIERCRRERTVRVYLCATYKGLLKERELLHDQTFPKLNDLFLNRGYHFTVADLRDKLTENETPTDHSLTVALSEIERSRPFFIAVLGDSYGWAHGQREDPLLAENFRTAETYFPFVSECHSKSFLEVEVLAGGLHPSMRELARPFIYIKDPGPTKALNEAQKQAGADATPYTAEELRVMAQKMEELKRTCQAAGFKVCRRFRDENELARMVLDDLSAVAARELPDGSREDPWEFERDVNEAFAQSRLWAYLPRAQLHESLDAYAQAPAGRACVVSGPTGSGKSSLLANWGAELRQRSPQDAVLLHFMRPCDADFGGPVPQDHRRLLRRLCHEARAWALRRGAPDPGPGPDAQLFEVEIGRDVVVPPSPFVTGGPAVDAGRPGLGRVAPSRTDLDPTEAPALRRRFTEWIAAVAAAGKGRVALVADGLESIPAWLPEQLPPGFVALLSTSSAEAVAEGKARGWASVEIPPLAKDEREAGIRLYLDRLFATLYREPPPLEELSGQHGRRPVVGLLHSVSFTGGQPAPAPAPAASPSPAPDARAVSRSLSEASAAARASVPHLALGPSPSPSLVAGRPQRLGRRRLHRLRALQARLRPDGPARLLFFGARPAPPALHPAPAPAKDEAASEEEDEDGGFVIGIPAPPASEPKLAAAPGKPPVPPASAPPPAAPAARAAIAAKEAQAAQATQQQQQQQAGSWWGPRRGPAPLPLFSVQGVVPLTPRVPASARGAGKPLLFDLIGLSSPRLVAGATPSATAAAAAAAAAAQPPSEPASPEPEPLRLANGHGPSPSPPPVPPEVLAMQALGMNRPRTASVIEADALVAEAEAAMEGRFAKDLDVIEEADLTLAGKIEPLPVPASAAGSGASRPPSNPLPPNVASIPLHDMQPTEDAFPSGRGSDVSSSPSSSRPASSQLPPAPAAPAPAVQAAAAAARAAAAASQARGPAAAAAAAGPIPRLPGAASGALWLRMFLDELRFYGTYQRVDERILGYLSAEGPAELWQAILARWEADYGAELVRGTLRLLALSRLGLSEAELRELGSVSGGAWGAFLMAARHSLWVGFGLYNFFHGSLLQAARSRYLAADGPGPARVAAERDALETHRQLAELLLRKLFALGPSGDASALLSRRSGRAYRETAHHLLCSEQWAALAAFLSRFEVWDLLSHDAYKHELVRLWERTAEGALASGGITPETDVVVAHRRMLEEWERAARPQHDALLDVLRRLSNFMHQVGRPDGCLFLFDRYAHAVKDTLGGKVVESDPRVQALVERARAVRIAAGVPKDVIEHLERHLAALVKERGTEAPEVAEELEKLGGYYAGEGRPQDAAMALAKAVALREKRHGREALELVPPLRALARVHRAQGETEKAVALLTRALQLREKRLGAHEAVAESLQELAGVHEAAGRVEAAIPLHLRLIALESQRKGKRHPDVATRLCNLAYLYEWSRKTAQAFRLYEEALAIDSEALGPDHPIVGTDMSNLAVLFESQQQHDAAVKLHRRALAIHEKALGPNHPDVAIDCNNLASVLRSQGKYAEAVPFFQRALTILKATVGPDHPDYGTILNNLGENLRLWGRTDDALLVFKQALRILGAAKHPLEETVRKSIAALAPAPAAAPKGGKGAAAPDKASDKGEKAGGGKGGKRRD
eukprot:tig00020902_g14970.t1